MNDNIINTAEQAVLGALLIDGDALDRIADLKAEHFYRFEHQVIFSEICKQAAAGKRVDVITLYETLRDKITDCLPYLNEVAQSVGSSANVSRYAAIVTDSAVKRALVALGREIEDIAARPDESGVLVDLVASKVEALASKKTQKEPVRLSDMLANFVQVMEDRIAGKVKPIATGHADLDKRLGGGLARGTITVVAARPSMGKTALGLGIARNVSSWGSALFLSMEMPAELVNDRNISALGKVPLDWVTNPNTSRHDENDAWSRVTHAFSQANDLNLYIDDETALNMLAIRNKARKVKRKHGLDVLVIDQLSFITGAQSDKSWEATGEYTRALLQIAKELNVAVILLCQLNRECEKRTDRRPIMADLALSGSIEQDASTIIFLYRDEFYNPDSQDKGMCEVIIRKNRQGQTGVVGLAYIGEQTRFEDLAHQWMPQVQAKSSRRGLAEQL